MQTFRSFNHESAKSLTYTELSIFTLSCKLIGSVKTDNSCVSRRLVSAIFSTFYTLVLSLSICFELNNQSVILPLEKLSCKKMLNLTKMYKEYFENNTFSRL